MNLEEESLQQKIESGTPHDGSADSKAYHSVFSSLSKEPEYKLPVYFAEMVVARLQPASETSKDLWWLMGGIFMLTIGLAVAIAFTISSIHINFGWGFLSGMIEYKWLLFSGVLAIALFNWIDRRLMREVNAI